MLQNLRAALLVPDIRKRIFFVFGAFALFVFMIHVQLPNVDKIFCAAARSITFSAS